MWQFAGGRASQVESWLAGGGWRWLAVGREGERERIDLQEVFRGGRERKQQCRQNSEEMEKRE